MTIKNHYIRISFASAEGVSSLSSLCVLSCWSAKETSLQPGAGWDTTGLPKPRGRWGLTALRVTHCHCWSYLVSLLSWFGTVRCRNDNCIELPLRSIHGRKTKITKLAHATGGKERCKRRRRWAQLEHAAGWLCQR